MRTLRAVEDQSPPPLREIAASFQSAHECHCVATQKLSKLCLSEMAEGARFDTTDVLETIGPDLTVSAYPNHSFAKIKGR